MHHLVMRRERAASLAVLISLAVAGCIGTFDDPGSTGDAGSICSGTVDVGPSQILRLSKTQYVNALTDIFGSAVITQLGSSLDQIPEDDTVTNPAVLTT